MSRLKNGADLYNRFWDWYNFNDEIFDLKHAVNNQGLRFGHCSIPIVERWMKYYLNENPNATPDKQVDFVMQKVEAYRKFVGEGGKIDNTKQFRKYMACAVKAL